MAPAEYLGSVTLAIGWASKSRGVRRSPGLVQIDRPLAGALLFCDSSRPMFVISGSRQTLAGNPTYSVRILSLRCSIKLESHFMKDDLPEAASTNVVKDVIRAEAWKLHEQIKATVDKRVKRELAHRAFQLAQFAANLDSEEQPE
jgi:hypothetical protein